MGAEARLKELGLELPTAAEADGNYVTAARSGNLLFLSGHGPLRDGRVVYQGKVGRDLTIEQGQEAARLTGLNLLASARDALGSLDRVRRVVKVLGMVQCADDFADHPKVINGFSDLMVEVFGDAGRHARSAVGMGSLPFGIAVEVEMILEVSGATGRAGSAPRRASTARDPKPAASLDRRSARARRVPTRAARPRRAPPAAGPARRHRARRPRATSTSRRARGRAALRRRTRSRARTAGSSTGAASAEPCRSAGRPARRSASPPRTRWPRPAPPSGPLERPTAASS